MFSTKKEKNCRRCEKTRNTERKFYTNYFHGGSYRAARKQQTSLKTFLSKFFFLFFVIPPTKNSKMSFHLVVIIPSFLIIFQTTTNTCVSISLLTPTRSLFLMWFVITYHCATHPTNLHHPFPLFFFIKININQIDKKLRLSLMMSTCYLGALSDLVENIFFLGVRLTKQKILPNYLANSILSVCLLYFVSIFKEEEIKS